MIFREILMQASPEMEEKTLEGSQLQEAYFPGLR
jgi:hypothetical protein